MNQSYPIALRNYRAMLYLFNEGMLMGEYSYFPLPCRMIITV
jgi:hypothetical protein